jgi:hypothetical protein
MQSAGRSRAPADEILAVDYAPICLGAAIHAIDRCVSSRDAVDAGTTVQAITGETP